MTLRGYGSLKVIGTDTVRLTTCDLLLTFRNIVHFVLLCVPAEGVPLELVTGVGFKKLE